jgi:nucleotide-binding universal stress UspA family protein
MSDAKTAANRRTRFLCVVDDTPECRVAVRYASQRAKNVGGGLSLLRVLAPPDAQAWSSVREMMVQEARDEAEKLMTAMAQRVFADSGIRPELIIRDGAPRDALLKLLGEDPSIRVLVLGGAPGSGGPGPLVSTLAGQMSGNLPVPVMVVPGNLTDEQVDAVT